MRLMGIDLEEWRQRQGLTYAKLAETIGVPSASQARRYALGEEMLQDERLEHVLAVSKGEVDLYALHRRRLAWRRSQAGERPVAIPDVPVSDAPPAVPKSGRLAAG